MRKEAVMKSPNTKAYGKAKTPDAAPEVRAFIYQELNDLDGLLPAGTALSVVVDDKANKNKVAIHLQSNIGNLYVESESKDVFKAIRKAKENLKDQLSALQSFLIETEDREMQIEHIINKDFLH